MTVMRWTILAVLASGVLLDLMRGDYVGVMGTLSGVVIVLVVLGMGSLIRRRRAGAAVEQNGRRRTTTDGESLSESPSRSQPRGKRGIWGDARGRGDDSLNGESAKGDASWSR